MLLPALHVRLEAELHDARERTSSPPRRPRPRSALDAAGITYKTENGGTQIDVVSARGRGRARRARREGRAQRRPRRLRALRQDEPRRHRLPAEGQLPARARGRDRPTIEQIQGVSSADVQLVLPDDTLFADEQSKATAGVLVDGGSSLDAATVRGIAPPRGLERQGPRRPGRDDHRRDRRAALADELRAAPATAQGKLQADSALRRAALGQINALLTATLGAGKALARVHADLNVDQTTVDKVTYAKKGVAAHAADRRRVAQEQGRRGAGVPAGTTTNTTPSYAASDGAGERPVEVQPHDRRDDVRRRQDRPAQRRRAGLGQQARRRARGRQLGAGRAGRVAAAVGREPRRHHAARGDTFAVSRIAFAKPPAADVRRAEPDPPTSRQPARPGAHGRCSDWPSLVFLFLMRRDAQAPRGRGLRARSRPGCARSRAAVAGRRARGRGDRVACRPLRDRSRADDRPRPGRGDRAQRARGGRPTRSRQWMKE